MKSRISTSELNVDSFGDMLKYLRKRAHLTQRELAIIVGYSEAHLSRLENNERLPDLATLAALFVPALGLDDQPEIVTEFLKLAASARGEAPPAGGKLTVIHSLRQEVVETLESVQMPGNLPLQLTSFIGREMEIEEITRLVLAEKARLVMLVGAGGCGKTRLAVQTAERFVGDFPQGVWFVDLASLSDPEQVPRLTASTLGLADASTEGLIAYLRKRKLLILFDNGEHLLLAVAQLVEAILASCPQIYVIATSREAFNISGERQFPVLPLAHPPESSRDKDRILRFASVRLFVERARNTLPAFDVTGEQAVFVARICRRLDGMPLAIELAAARIGSLSIRQIETQLNNRFHLLTGGRRTLPRHQTLRAMIDWSYQLLADEERRLFRWLSVFAGGWTLEAAQSLFDLPASASALEALSHLIDKSFVVVERFPHRDVRYGMLETLREYAREKLVAAQETEATRGRHFDYFYSFACSARLYGPEKQVWLDRLEADVDNIRAAVTWALTYSSDGGSPANLVRVTEMILALLDFFWFRGFTVEARDWMDRCLAVSMPASPLRARLLQKAGWFARGGGDFKQADVLLKRALEMSYEIEDRNRASWALADLGLSARDQGDNQQAIAYFSEALTLARETGDRREIGDCLYFLAESHVGDLDLSMSLWEQGLAVHREDGDKTHIAWGLEGLAGVALMKRDYAGAVDNQLQSLRIKCEVMDRLGIAYSLEGLAQIAAAEEEPERATVLWGAASHLREIMNIPLDPSRAELYTSLIPQTRQQLGTALFDAYWKRGAAMELEAAIEYALHPEA